MAELDLTREVHGFPGSPIDVDAIARELSGLWQAPDVDELRREAVVPSRTSVLNLIVHATDPDSAARVEQVVDRLAVHHPSRVIIFAVSHEPGDFSTDVDAEVNAHCLVRGAESRLAPCYEQVTIPTPPDALPYLRTVIDPLLLPDLPTILWWTGPLPLHDRDFARTVTVADRLIFDSLAFTQGAANLGRVADLCRAVADRCALSDLAWTRLRQWRELTAHFFDIPEHRWALDEVTRVTVSYGRGRGQDDNPVEAFLYAGWAASRLGWQLVRGERRERGGWEFLVRRAEGGELTLIVKPVTVSHSFHGALMSAALAARDRWRSAEFSAARVGDRSAIRMAIGQQGRTVLEHAVRCAPPDLSTLLVHELNQLGRDRVFEDALHEARHFADALRLWGIP
ncbi:MAG TPA: glucose-6-phosphate dehydrogenase assembly protein OpcA [Thermomicrobiaceae bacterium]|nr:glucose-6-phosphate dehydrogenase assembly protein OpcA [Thermomicrobiaceae bacterium]